MNRPLALSLALSLSSCMPPTMAYAEEDLATQLQTGRDTLTNLCFYAGMLVQDKLAKGEDKDPSMRERMIAAAKTCHALDHLPKGLR